MNDVLGLIAEHVRLNDRQRRLEVYGGEWETLMEDIRDRDGTPVLFFDLLEERHNAQTCGGLGIYYRMEFAMAANCAGWWNYILIQRQGEETPTVLIEDNTGMTRQSGTLVSFGDDGYLCVLEEEDFDRLTRIASMREIDYIAYDDISIYFNN